MKFIFPQNYNFKSKLFGTFDYSTIIINIIFCFPLFLLSLLGFNGENISYVFLYLIKFLFRQKSYLFSKDKYF